MEIRDLYDENKTLIGETIEKGQPIPAGRYYITVVVFIENDNGEFLLQQRAQRKDGKWATTGGHPTTGESSLDGIITEIQEEIGIIANPNDLILFKTIKTEDDFVDLYYTKMNFDINDVTIQEEEVQNVMWASRNEIEELVKNNQFSSSHKEFYDYCLVYLNN